MKVTECCLCKSTKLEKVLDLGSSGLANNLEVTKEYSIHSKKYPLELLICDDCNHIQLSEEVDPEILFSNYGYETGVSQIFRTHFNEYANRILSALGTSDGVVVDIGSNDCTLLDYLKELGFRTIGVEPAKNLVEKYKHNHELINSFFNTDVVEEILHQYGKVDVVTANNVFAHNRNLTGFSNLVKTLLKTGGLFVVEVQYLYDLIENGCFDMIYHEHTSYHHIKPIRLMMEQHGMYLIDVQHITTHGGSIRLVFQNTETDPCITNELIQKDEQFDKSIRQSIASLEKYVFIFKNKFEEIINDLRKKYDCIYGYASPAKVVTLLSVIDDSVFKSIEFIIDDGTLKQNKFLPGYGIEIIGTEKALERLKDKSSVCIVFAWNIAEDIKKKISSTNLNPNIVVVPLPKLEIFQ